jgi:hypothetical protein
MLALNHPTTHRAGLAALALVALLATACQAQSVPGGRAAGAGGGAEAALRARLDAEIGDARCTEDAQCRTLAVGAKACGGPQGWVAWSTAVSRAEPLQALAAELAQRQKVRNEVAGAVSDCSVVPDPGARCVAQRCTLRSPDLPVVRPANTR